MSQHRVDGLQAVRGGDREDEQGTHTCKLGFKQSCYMD